MKTLRLDEENKKNVLENLLKRSTGDYQVYEKRVADILENVRTNGDEAVFQYSEKFDSCVLNKDTIRVTKEEIATAYESVGKDYVKVLNRAKKNIVDFHSRHMRKTWYVERKDQSVTGQRISALRVTGLYVPGGKAAYPSSVLMAAIPAKVAGVGRIVITTPPDKEGKINPAVLVAADIAGVDEIYKVGGAQAIAAMAYGTESIPRVDKIVGPGNIYVALAKKAVYGSVSIDSIAGPSEILVLADATSNPKYVAADLLSQAEHDEMASAILITTDPDLPAKVEAEIAEFLKTLNRRSIIEKSLEKYGYFLIADSIQDMADAANEIASEHLEILLDNPEAILDKIYNAGAIFLGEYSCEPVGDYYAGPNHILPTNGTSRFSSPLNTDDFMKKTSIIQYSQNALMSARNDIIKLAMSEGLDAHANAVKARFDDNEVTD